MFRSLENDAAVLKAYGWPTDLAEPEIVSRLCNRSANTVIKKHRGLGLERAGRFALRFFSSYSPAFDF